MCTVTFVPRPTGFLLAMNRDESRVRPVGLPPRIVQTGNRRMLGPQEKSGGSWLRVNDAGMACALLNWYGVPQHAVSDPISRGDVLNQIAQTDDTIAASTRLKVMELNRVRPFRLIAFDRLAQALVEFRWDQKKFQKKRHPWRLTQWASSGYDEPAAQQARSVELTHKLKLATAGTTGWLRGLHRSHLPERGAFSACVHREDAATVSYTELSVTRNRAAMRHFNDSPCKMITPHDFDTQDMPLNWARLKTWGK